MLEVERLKGFGIKIIINFLFPLLHDSGETIAEDEEQPLWSLFTSIAKVRPVT